MFSCFGIQPICLRIRDMSTGPQLLAMQTSMPMQLQSEKGLDIAKELGAENYVFWGGREGYETLLNTDMKLELENLSSFYRMAVEYAREIGFDGQF